MINGVLYYYININAKCNNIAAKIQDPQLHPTPTPTLPLPPPSPTPGVWAGVSIVTKE